MIFPEREAAAAGVEEKSLRCGGAEEKTGTEEYMEDHILEDRILKDHNILEDSILENPVLENPVLEDPVLEDPVLEEAPGDRQSGRTRLSDTSAFPEGQTHSGGQIHSEGQIREGSGMAEKSLSGRAAAQGRRAADEDGEALKSTGLKGGKGGKNAVAEELSDWARSFVIMFIIALFLTQFIIINAVIPSGSMEDTIMTHDRLIGARFSYWFEEPERGDIVIFRYPVDENRIYIKRIIGLPGETVRIDNGQIYIDDSEEPLQEGYLKEEWEVLNSDLEFHVPEGSYLMFGDNRNWSEDARYWADNALNAGVADTEEEAEKYAYVRKDKILGKAVFTYFRWFRILKHGEWYE